MRKQKGRQGHEKLRYKPVGSVERNIIGANFRKRKEYSKAHNY